MDRRDFLHLASLGVLSLATTRPVSAGGGGRHWAWITARADTDPVELRRRFVELRGYGVSAVLVGGGSPAAYALAREAGLEVHAWMWTLCRSDLLLVRSRHCGVLSLADISASGADQRACVERFRTRVIFRT